MEVIKLRYANLLRACKKLEHMIVKLQNARLRLDIDEDDLTAYRDSVIKCFEICYDLL